MFVSRKLGSIRLIHDPQGRINPAPESRVAIPPAPVLDVRAIDTEIGSKSHLRAAFSSLAILSDCLSLALSLAMTGYWHHAVLSGSVSLLTLPTILPPYLVVGTSLRAFSGPVLLSWRTAMKRSLFALGICMGTFAISAGFLVSDARQLLLNLGILLVTAAVLLALFRGLHVRYATRRLGGSLQSVVELRDGVPPSGTQFSIDTSHFFDPRRPNPFSLSELAAAIGRADRIVLRCPAERRSAWAQVLAAMHVQAEIVLPEFNGFAPLCGNFYGSERTLIIAAGRLSFQGRALKRLFDIVSSAGALVLLAPLLLIVAIAIKIDSPGPILFRQPRIGRQNKLFCMLKFRTMATASCDPTGICSTARNDPRITRTGGFLRRTSIDELPQLLNVLRGEMSIVGPRPHAINSTVEDRLFWDADRKYWMRHGCKPGLTGLAQVRGLRGATDCMKDLVDRIEADLSYLHCYSFWNDLVIIALTLRVLVGKKAY